MKLELAAALAVVVLSACSASGPLYESAPVPNGQTAIYVYRPHRGFQISGYPYVYVDDRVSHSLKNSSYGVSFVAPGRHEVKVSGSLMANWMLPDARVVVEAIAGQSVYVRYTPEPTGAYVIGKYAGVTGSSNLREISEREAVDEIEKTRRSD
jgi:uncharacterized protein DUF2846